MQNKLRTKWSALLLTLSILFSMIPTTTAHAQAAAWIPCGNGSYLLENTDIMVSISNDTIHVSGNGAIPDYEESTLAQRPWNESTCKYLVIDSNITSIGAYAFADLNALEHITLYSTTFIDSKSSFTGIAHEPVFRIKGYAESVTYYGTIPYTSLDSIKAFAMNSQHYASFLLDEPYMVSLFQNSTNPTIPNVYCAYDTTKPWDNVDDNLNGNVSTDCCTFSSLTPAKGLSVETQFGGVRTDFYEIFANFIEDNTFASAFTMQVTWDVSSRVVNNTLYDYMYELTIPDEFIQPGRTFRIIAVGTGKVEILEDVDTSDATITFVTNTPTKTCALVYKD